MGGRLGPQPLRVDEAHERVELYNSLSGLPRREPFLQRTHLDKAVHDEENATPNLLASGKGKLCNRCGRLVLPQLFFTISGSPQRVATQKVSSVETVPAGPTMLPNGDNGESLLRRNRAVKKEGSTYQVSGYVVGVPLIRVAVPRRPYWKFRFNSQELATPK